MHTPLYFAKIMDSNSQPYNNKWTRVIKQTLLNGLEIRSQKKQKKSSDTCIWCKRSTGIGRISVIYPLAGVADGCSHDNSASYLRCFYNK